MKYLVIVRPRNPPPPDRAADIVRGTKDWLATRTKDRTIDYFHGFVSGGGVGVVNADSHETLMRLIRERPTFPFTSTEVHALVDINQGLDSALQAFQKMSR